MSSNILEVTAKRRLGWIGHLRRISGKMCFGSSQSHNCRKHEGEPTKRQIKNKSKVVSIHAITACMESRGMAPFILKPRH